MESQGQVETAQNGYVVFQVLESLVNYNEMVVGDDHYSLSFYLGQSNEMTTGLPNRPGRPQASYRGRRQVFKTSSYIIQIRSLI